MSDTNEAKCPVLQSPHTATGSSANQTLVAQPAQL